MHIWGTNNEERSSKYESLVNHLKDLENRKMVTDLSLFCLKTEVLIKTISQMKKIRLWSTNSKRKNDW